MPEGAKVVVPDGRRCQLYYFTGKVLSSQKQKETQISSGSQYNAGTGQTVATVSSRQGKSKFTVLNARSVPALSARKNSW